MCSKRLRLSVCPPSQNSDPYHDGKSSRCVLQRCGKEDEAKELLFTQLVHVGLKLPNFGGGIRSRRSGRFGDGSALYRYDKVLRQKPAEGHEAQRCIASCRWRFFHQIAQVDVTVLAVACNNVVALRHRLSIHSIQQAQSNQTKEMESGIAGI